MSKRKQVAITVLLVAAAVTLGLAVPLIACEITDAGYDGVYASIEETGVNIGDAESLTLDEKLRLVSSRDIYIIDTDEGRTLKREGAAAVAESYISELYALGFPIADPESIEYDLESDVYPVVLINDSGSSEGVLAWCFTANGTSDSAVMMLIDDESAAVLGMICSSGNGSSGAEPSLVEVFAQYFADKIGARLMEIERIDSDISLTTQYRLRLSFDNGFTYVPLNLRFYENYVSLNMD